MARGEPSTHARRSLSKQQQQLLKWINDQGDSTDNDTSDSGDDETPSAPDLGFVASLFRVDSRQLTRIFRCVEGQRTIWTTRQRLRLADSCGRLRLWGDVVDSGKLELCLRVSPDVHSNVLDLLYRLGRTLVKG
jgi:hypothetical protein